MPPSSGLEQAPGVRIAVRKLDKTFGIEDQGAAYFSS
jgi:hypothetical protein